MKASIRILLFLAVLLTACGAPAETTGSVPIPLETAAETAAPTDSLTATVESTPTAALSIATSAPVDISMDGCTLQTLLAPPSATEVSRFPVPGVDDWQTGLETAAVTIIEYGDFQ